MAAPDVDANAALKDLLTSSWINELILVAGVLALAGLWLYNRNRDRQAKLKLSRDKDLRAEAYEARTKSLEQSLFKMGSSVEKSYGNLLKVIQGLDPVMAQVESVMSRVSGKLESKLSRRLSFELIRHEFSHLSIRIDGLMGDLVDSLSAKDARTDHVARQFRTDVAEQMDRSLVWLNLFPLTQRADPFFALDPISSSRRYQLVDQLWAALERAWSGRNRRGPDGQMVDEFELIVRNLIDDYVSAIESRLKTASSANLFMAPVQADSYSPSQPPVQSPAPLSRRVPVPPDEDSGRHPGDRGTDTIQSPGTQS